ncbi:hypothetical protein [Arachnia propionica]|jgi:TP901 family phage tail tape measure protein|uniref:Uncharacterized protein n=1 Tax=Arachnia propionica TaxID=1750 RepID=A0A3S5ESP6_9ACTN|nr:hypothetical protein [Arachnia propionica]VEH70260.1 Uncharacterised protein [Arachnia propionica]
MKILTALLDGIIAVLPQLDHTATTLITSLVQAIIMALPSLLSASVQVVTTLVSGIGQALPTLSPRGGANDRHTGAVMSQEIGMA